jgi:hypothetical protein
VVEIQVALALALCLGPPAAPTRADEVSMRRALLFSFAAVWAVACGYGYEARTTTITGAPMITSGPAVGEPELPRTLSATSEAIALEVCKHENHCGRASVPSCVNATVPRARRELKRWVCEPAAIRARFEECLAGFNELSCEVDLIRTQKRPLCPPNIACGDVAAHLIPPGPALAEIWR